MHAIVEARTPGRLQALPAFSDNYIWLLESRDGRRCLVVDPGDPAPVLAMLASRNLQLEAILVTHHHFDHAGGVNALSGGRVAVYGPAGEQIPGVTRPLRDGERFTAADVPFTVLDVPGHTAGHIAFAGDLDGTPLLFCGDTLFSAGCGRLFEGSPEEMHASLGKLAALPADTLVCCAHEYTLGNLRFAAAAEPGNPDIAAYTAWALDARAAGRPTLPSTLARELAVNPFLRTQAPALRAQLLAQGLLPAGADDTACFAALRRWKDGFH
jgi:hydroxyacylglutathione hydrolase